MTILVRRVLLLLATTLGLVAATAGPASAGLSFTNHCQPAHDETAPDTSINPTTGGRTRRTARRILLLLATTLGLVAATAGSASAGFNLGNHCEPAHDETAPDAAVDAPTSSRTRRTARRILLLLATTLGLVAATAGSASAGFNLGNHCEPAHDETAPDATVDAPTSSRTRRTARRILLLLATTLGLVAATAGPASAGLILNHCEPQSTER